MTSSSRPSAYMAPPAPSSQSQREMLLQAQIMRRPPTHLDEGYSEDTRSDAGGSDASMTFATKDSYYDSILDAALGLTVDQRRDLAYAISRTLPVSHIAYNKARLDCLLYFDPVQKLPNELFYLVLAELDPRDLLNASAVSRPWRDRAMRDERLWRYCFARQGWILDQNRKSALEQEAEQVKDRMVAMEALSRKKSGQDLQRRPSRKRAREEAFSEGEPSLDTPAPPLSRPRSRAGSSGSMEGVEVAKAARPATGFGEGLEQEGEASNARLERRDSMASDSAVEDLSDDLQLQPTMFQLGQPKLSWPWLYKHRCMLERNWERGNYRMFQLPHPAYQSEGHDECVYTIQHSGSHLVSGSRDKTIRIWDLETCRLKIPPLKGHQASVLCLQFDERPDHDIIVSGGSDSWVIIWQFSTGKIIKKMTGVHSESVLNLRFDDRYIVTCSKDKTIKIWNRRALSRSDPLVPHFVLPRFNNPTDPDSGGMIKEYTMLCALIGHHAAVNAVQIHEDTIVSASGDRTIKAWNIHSGTAVKTYFGHTKGIACVQFDGRRIVSGSSDQTVRVFDADRGVEVACLEGHGNLVRTVQARFGDMDIMTDEELVEEAKKADRGVRNFLARGGQLPPPARRGHRNAGSSNPQDMMAMGASVPPGGGGSRWARIVSGSYDERVIIWAKDRDGNWRPQHCLSQDSLLRHSHRHNINNVGVPRTSSLPLPFPHGLLDFQPSSSLTTQTSPLGILHSRIVQQFGGGSNSSAPRSLLDHHAPSHAHLSSSSAAASSSSRPAAALTTVGQILSDLNSSSAHASTYRNNPPTHAAVHQAQQVHHFLGNAVQSGPAPLAHSSASASPATANRLPGQHQLQQTLAHAVASSNGLANIFNENGSVSENSSNSADVPLPHQSTSPSSTAAQPPTPSDNVSTTVSTGNQPSTSPSAPSHPAATGLYPPQPPALHPPSLHQQQQQPPPPPPVAANPRPVHSDSSRVFKLQFDARRIICCSQNRVIVGWDFANGDPDLEIVGNLSNETL